MPLVCFFILFNNIRVYFANRGELSAQPKHFFRDLSVVVWRFYLPVLKILNMSPGFRYFTSQVFDSCFRSLALKKKILSLFLQFEQLIPTLLKSHKSFLKIFVKIFNILGEFRFFFSEVLQFFIKSFYFSR